MIKSLEEQVLDYLCRITQLEQPENRDILLNELPKAPVTTTSVRKFVPSLMSHK